MGRYVIENLKQLRDARRLTYRELADRLAELGRPIPTLGLSRIEKGTRRVDADDLVALAIALGVNPAALLLPRDTGPGDEIELAENFPAAAVAAWEWSAGHYPLPVPDADHLAARSPISRRTPGRNGTGAASPSGAKSWSAATPR